MLILWVIVRRILQSLPCGRHLWRLLDSAYIVSCFFHWPRWYSSGLEVLQSGGRRFQRIPMAGYAMGSRMNLKLLRDLGLTSGFATCRHVVSNGRQCPEDSGPYLRGNKRRDASANDERHFRGLQSSSARSQSLTHAVSTANTYSVVVLFVNEAREAQQVQSRRVTKLVPSPLKLHRQPH